MTTQASSSRRRRSATPGKSRPSMVCSTSAHPAPMPNSSRPPDRWSTVVAILASTPGCRYVLPVTMLPIRTRRVDSAIAAMSVQPSQIGPSRGAPPIGLKWSKTQTWSKPASSARRHTARCCSRVQSCCESLMPTRTGWPFAAIMKTMMRVLSIQVGRPRQMPPTGDGADWDRRWRTAFVKEPVAGPVMLGRLGLEGDSQADLMVHGGPDMAVLAYSADHYPLWHRELALAGLGPGGFGENL